MGKEDYLGGKRPNGADLAVFGILKSIEELPAFRWIKDNRKAWDWYQRVNRAALKAA